MQVPHRKFQDKKVPGAAQSCKKQWFCQQLDDGNYVGRWLKLCNWKVSLKSPEAKS